MKKYIIKNLEPLLVGFAVAMVVNNIFSIVESIILKIAILTQG